jgi:hypothetical protein
MIDEIDEALRKFLIREVPIKNGEVDIKFEQPRREWSARLSRPTLNLFLYDIRENPKMRAQQPAWIVEKGDNGGFTRRRQPAKFRLFYVVTAWAKDPEDEHRLLSRTLMALFRHPRLPGDLLPEASRDLEGHALLQVAQEEDFQNASDLWSAMDNEMRPAIVCVVTMTVDPYLPVSGALVRTRELRIGPSGVPPSEQLDQGVEPDVFWTIGGTVRTQEPLDGIRLKLVERDQDIAIQSGGRFSIGRMEAGEYTLEVSGEGRDARRYKISVPAADYDLEV